MKNSSAKIIGKTMILLFLLIFACLLSSTTSLANCPPACQCDDNILVVQCYEGQLDVLPIALNPSIQRLIIRRNKIKTIDSSLTFYAELLLLDLANNLITNIPQRTFAYQKKLQELHLNANKIAQLNNRTFIGLQTLTLLNLRGNLISDLQAGVFNALPHLEHMNLGENRINFIDTHTFDPLTRLKVLYLDDNALTAVPDRLTLQNVPLLAKLMLGGNALEYLPAQAFDYGGQALTHLDLRGSNLRNISTQAFLNLNNSLRVLDLSQNRLAKIPTQALSVLHQLEHLILGENPFDIVAENAFKGLDKLSKLDISNALNLRVVARGAFAWNKNLQNLKLAQNKVLTDIQVGALRGLNHLRQLNLKSNAISTLSEHLFAWRQLESFDINDNPLLCDCQILWLRNLLLLGNLSNTSANEHIVCAYPEQLNGESLMKLNSQLLGCLYDDEAKHQALIGALLVGIAATLTTLVLLIYRCRHRLRLLWKQSERFGGRNKEREYQKTLGDDGYMTCQHLSATNDNMPPYVAHENQHYISHQPACNMYTPREEQAASAASKNACSPACLDESASFMMLMKYSMLNNTSSQDPTQQPTTTTTLQRISCVTKDSSVGSSSNESSYSYVDVPLVHTLSNYDFQQQQQQQQIQQYEQGCYLSAHPEENIYSNMHYAHSLERHSNVASGGGGSKGTTRKKGTRKVNRLAKPPALPLRNELQLNKQMKL